MVSMKINNVTVSLEQYASIQEDATEEFDNGNGFIIYTTKREAYEDFADVELTLGTNTFEYILQKDVSSRVTPTIYKHELILAEYVTKLAFYQHPDRKFDTVDGDKTTWLYHLQRILESVIGGNPFTIATATQTLLGEDADEKEYTGGNLLISVLDIFRANGLVPTLDSDNEIGHRLISDYGSLVSFDRIDGEIIESDIGDYGYRSISKVKNATYEANLITGGTYYPSVADSITVRSLDPRYTDETAVYILDTDIRRIIEAKLTNYKTYSSLFLNIVSKEEWDNLPINRKGSISSSDTYAGTDRAYQGDYKNNTLYFDGNVIYNVGTEWNYETINRTGIWGAIQRALYILEGDVTNGNVLDVSPKSLEAQFYYQPIRDITVSQIRNNYDRVDKNATVLNPQQDSIVELNRFGQANKSFINRMGNDTYTVTVRYNDTDDPLELFDYTSSGYKIIKRAFVFRGTKYDVTYFLTKNQSQLEPLTGVKYESVSPFTITRKNILTNFIQENIYEFSDTSKTDTSDDDTGDILMHALASGASGGSYVGANDTPIYAAVFNRGSDYFNMTVQSVPMGNSFEFNAQFNSPNIAGYKRIEDGSTTIIDTVNYTDEFGQVATATVKFDNDVASSAVGTHPVGTDITSPLMTTGATTYNLQPNEIFAITAVRHCISDVDGLIIGDYFLENNSLIKEIGVAQDIAVGYYDTNPKYTIFDRYVKGTPDGSGTLTVGGTDSKYFDVGSLTGKSWVVYDTNNDRVYFAFNYTGTSLTRVYRNLLETDPNISTL